MSALTEIRGISGSLLRRRRDVRGAREVRLDLVAEAAAGRLEPVIGRDSEIRRTIQTCPARFKNNPVLIGEPGVRKTAIVEGLAQRIHNDVLEGLRDKTVLRRPGVAGRGRKYRGEFEERPRQSSPR